MYIYIYIYIYIYQYIYISIYVYIYISIYLYIYIFIYLYFNNCKPLQNTYINVYLTQLNNSNLNYFEYGEVSYSYMNTIECNIIM